MILRKDTNNYSAFENDLSHGHFNYARSDTALPVTSILIILHLHHPGHVIQRVQE